MPPCCASIESLSDDVLGTVFMLLPQRDRIKALPLVCSRWCRIIAHASMWPSLHFVLFERDEYVSRALPWLRKRIPGMRELTLQFLCSADNLQPTLMCVVPAATQLQRLTLLSDGRGHAETFDVQALACVSALTHLSYLRAALVGTPLDLPALDDLLASLPALQALHFTFCTNHHPLGTETTSNAEGLGNQPQSRERQDSFLRSLLRCTGLTSLDLSHVSKPRGVGDSMFTVGSIAAGITMLQRLQWLSLVNTLTAPLPRSFSQLTQLTSLTIAHESDAHNRLLFQDADGLVALPTSLLELEVVWAPVEVLAPLTALKWLTLDDTVSTAPGRACALSTLQQLTALRLGAATDAALEPFGGCTGLRFLSLSTLDAQELQPLPYQQLTHLELVSGHFTASNIQAMISGLLQLETLEVIDAEEAFDLLAVDAVALSKLPKLRLVNLSGSVLWDGGPTDQPVQGDAKLSYLPLPVVHHLMCLQRAVPNIEWELGHDQHWPPSSPWWDV